MVRSVVIVVYSLRGAASGADPTITNKAGMTCLDCVKDPERRSKLQRVLKIPAHKFKGTYQSLPQGML